MGAGESACAFIAARLCILGDVLCVRKAAEREQADSAVCVMLSGLEGGPRLASRHNVLLRCVASHVGGLWQHCC